MEVSKPSLRVKLEYLFRLLAKLQHLSDHSPELYSVEMNQQVLNDIFTAGFWTIHQGKRDGSWSNSEHGYKQASLLIQQAFQQLLDEMNEELTSGLPITLTLGKCELMISERMDELTDDLVMLYENV